MGCYGLPVAIVHCSDARRSHGSVSCRGLFDFVYRLCLWIDSFVLCFGFEFDLIVWDCGFWKLDCFYVESSFIVR